VVYGVSVIERGVYLIERAEKTGSTQGGASKKVSDTITKNLEQA
jgi:hypothetical protein